jgi:hypothetical protein
MPGRSRCRRRLGTSIDDPPAEDKRRFGQAQWTVGPAVPDSGDRSAENGASEQLQGGGGRRSRLGGAGSPRSRRRGPRPASDALQPLPPRQGSPLDGAAVETGHQLRPLLHKALADRWACVPAARALWRHGTDPAELIEPLIDSATDWIRGSRAVALLVEMDAKSAAAQLAELAERDQRSINSGNWDDTVWEDERLQQELRQAAAALSE